MPRDLDESSVSAIALKSLADYGRLLDNIDAQRVAMSAHQFRKAAVFALRLLRQRPEHPAVEAVCANSPSLSEMLETARSEREPTSCGELQALLQRWRA